MNAEKNRMFKNQNGYRSPLQQTEEPVYDNEEIEEAAREQERLKGEMAEESPEEKVANFLQSRHGISQRQIQQWKSEFGNIYLLPLDDDEIYIYRPVKSIEFTNLLLRLRNMPNVNDNTSDLELIRLCLIYPKLDPIAFNALPAGLVGTLRMGIQKVSRFLSEEEVAQLTLRL